MGHNDGNAHVLNPDGQYATLQFFLKMAEEMVTRFLGNCCPSTRQLAAFVATRSKELLPAGALACILESINKHGEGLEYEVEEVDAKVMMRGDGH